MTRNMQGSRRERKGREEVYGGGSKVAEKVRAHCYFFGDQI